MQHIAARKVADELSLPAQQPRILDALDRAADQPIDSTFLAVRANVSWIMHGRRTSMTIATGRLYPVQVAEMQMRALSA
jgi:hypothetical protein